jgi:hypothetical protein
MSLPLKSSVQRDKYIETRIIRLLKLLRNAAAQTIVLGTLL